MPNNKFFITREKHIFYDMKLFVNIERHKVIKLQSYIKQPLCKNLYLR